MEGWRRETLEIPGLQFWDTRDLAGARGGKRQPHLLPVFSGGLADQSLIGQRDLMAFGIDAHVILRRPRCAGQDVTEFEVKTPGSGMVTSTVAATRSVPRRPFSWLSARCLACSSRSSWVRSLSSSSLASLRLRAWSVAKVKNAPHSSGLSRLKASPRAMSVADCSPSFFSQSCWFVSACCRPSSSETDSAVLDLLLERAYLGFGGHGMIFGGDIQAFDARALWPAAAGAHRIAVERFWQAADDEYLGASFQGGVAAALHQRAVWIDGNVRDRRGQFHIPLPLIVRVLV